MEQRPIKFRAWQPHHSLHRKPGMYEVQDMVWYEPTPEGYTGEVFLAKPGEEAKSSEYFQDVKLMQYTGLKDKNGVEIYEGDILLEPTGVFGEDLGENGSKRSVRWDGREWTTSLPDELHIGYAGHAPFADWAICEVIGNIYKNPDLLTPKENE